MAYIENDNDDYKCFTIVLTNQNNIQHFLKAVDRLIWSRKIQTFRFFQGRRKRRKTQKPTIRNFLIRYFGSNIVSKKT